MMYEEERFQVIKLWFGVTDLRTRLGASGDTSPGLVFARSAIGAAGSPQSYFLLSIKYMYLRYVSLLLVQLDQMVSAIITSEIYLRFSFIAPFASNIV